MMPPVCSSPGLAGVLPVPGCEGTSAGRRRRRQPGHPESGFPCDWRSCTPGEVESGRRPLFPQPAPGGWRCWIGSLRTARRASAGLVVLMGTMRRLSSAGSCGPSTPDETSEGIDGRPHARYTDATGLPIDRNLDRLPFGCRDAVEGHVGRTAPNHGEPIAEHGRQRGFQTLGGKVGQLNFPGWAACVAASGQGGIRRGRDYGIGD